jgi:Antitoxin VbhA
VTAIGEFYPKGLFQRIFAKAFHKAAVDPASKRRRNRVFFKEGAERNDHIYRARHSTHMCSVAHAIAQQELKGLKITASTVVDLHRAARGEINTDEVIRNTYRRVQNVSLLLQ